MRVQHSLGSLSDLQLDAWAKIDRGIKSDDPTKNYESNPLSTMQESMKSISAEGHKACHGS